MAKVTTLSRVDDFHTITHAEAGAVEAYDIYLINGMVGYAYEDLAAGAAGEWVVADPRLIAPKDNSDVTEGDLLYWDNSAKNFTKTAVATTLCGVALKAAGTGASEVEMALDYRITN